MDGNRETQMTEVEKNEYNEKHIAQFVLLNKHLKNKGDFS